MTREFGWKKVTDELPDEGAYVLVSGVFLDSHEYYVKAFLLPTGWYKIHDGDMFKLEDPVSYWTYIPDPE